MASTNSMHSISHYGLVGKSWHVSIRQYKNQNSTKIIRKQISQHYSNIFSKNLKKILLLWMTLGSIIMVQSWNKNNYSGLRLVVQPQSDKNMISIYFNSWIFLVVFSKLSTPFYRVFVINFQIWRIFSVMMFTA